MFYSHPSHIPLFYDDLTMQYIFTTQSLTDACSNNAFLQVFLCLFVSIASALCLSDYLLHHVHCRFFFCRRLWILTITMYSRIISFCVFIYHLVKMNIKVAAATLKATATRAHTILLGQKKYPNFRNYENMDHKITLLEHMFEL